MNSGRSPTVERVLRGRLCSGCGLCADASRGALRMEMVEPGFARPVQHGPVDPAAERVIADCCPGAVVAAWQEGPNMHPYWGPWRQAFTGHAADPLVRHRASSGGALSGLLIHALKKGLVDRIIQIGADPNQPTGNVLTCSTTAEEVLANAGSRYAASSPLMAISQALADGGAAAFVGKPCDVSALRRLARSDPRVERHVPLALSFFCAGVPSARGADNILAALKVDRRDLVAFRYRGHGWPGDAVATLRDGQTRRMSYNESWGDYLADQVQFRCKICPDAVGGVADIACADAWYGDAKGYPSFDERDGRSVVMTRTQAGADLVSSAALAGDLELTPLDPEQIERMQPSQALRKRVVRARTTAMGLALQPRPAMRGVMVDEAARRASLYEMGRNFVGTLRRIIIRRK
jgi:coenzyme F420 hydrogenase subunit beta